MPLNNIRHENGLLIVEVDGKLVAKIPESFVLNTLSIDPNLLPLYQRLVMQAKGLIEEFAELTINADGDVADAMPKHLHVKKREAATAWLKREHAVRHVKRTT
jgi:hypothetical protein